MRTEPLAPTFGTRVAGLDLTAEHPEATWEDLRALLRRTRLLAFPGQDLDDDAQLDVARRFGRPAWEGLGERRQVMYVAVDRAVGILGTQPTSWHLDFGFFPDPYRHLCLYGVEIPPSGSQTWFTDAVAAASRLPAELRARVQGLVARQIVDVASPAGEAGVRIDLGRLDHTYPHQLRPVLWPHPDTGEEVLAVCEQHTDALFPTEPDAAPLTDHDSEALIRALFAHLYAPAFRYTHEWSEGDLVVWDNLALQHARPSLEGVGARTLRRVALGADQDLALFARRAP